MSNIRHVDKQLWNIIRSRPKLDQSLHLDGFIRLRSMLETLVAAKVSSSSIASYKCATRENVCDSGACNARADRSRTFRRPERSNAATWSLGCRYEHPSICLCLCTALYYAAICLVPGCSCAAALRYSGIHLVPTLKELVYSRKPTKRECRFDAAFMAGVAPYV
jgi:hypothetical protein